MEFGLGPDALPVARHYPNAVNLFSSVKKKMVFEILFFLQRYHILQKLLIEIMKLGIYKNALLLQERQSSKGLSSGYYA